MDSERPSSFGVLLREARLAKGLSQELLAEHARVSAEAISALERGRRKTPQRETLELLLDALQPHESLRAQLKAAAVRPPGPSRRELHQPSAAPSDEAGRRRGNLPRPLTAFFGREPELRTLALILSKHRLVTLTGSGGVGKTRTALELAFRSAGGFREGAWFVELGPLRDPALVPKAIAAALAIPERADTPLLDVIVATLREQQRVLLLDNCEHLIDAAATTAHAILSRCAEIVIVAASREPLRVDGEAVYRLTALDVPDDTAKVTPENALSYSALALFVERSCARDAAFALTPSNTRFAAEICRRLDGNPLALELAAAKTSVLSLAQITARLNERFALLTGGARTALPRHQTLRALIEWSFDLLKAQEQELFLGLAVFAGSWNLAAAEAMTAGGSIAAADVVTLVSSLVDKSLVVVDPASPDSVRFRLLETTREYAAEKLRETGRFESAMRRHTAYVLAFARRAQSLLQEVSDSNWLEMVQTELENIRTALEWNLRDRDDVAAGAEIAAALGFFWESRSHEEGIRWLAAAGSVVDDLNEPLAAFVLAELVGIQPSSEETHLLARRSLKAYRAVHDEVGIAGAIEYLGRTLINLGRYAEAVETLEEGLRYTLRANDDGRGLRLTALLAFAHLYGGNTAAAKLRLADAAGSIALRTRMRDRAMISRADAEIALASGEFARAVDAAEQTLDLGNRIGDLRGIGMARNLVAQVLAEAGRIGEARAHARAAVRNLTHAQIPVALVEAYLVAASILERQREDERAARLIGFARARAATLPFHSAFLITGLLDRTVSALTARLGTARFEQLVATGAVLDEQSALAELDEGFGEELTNRASGVPPDTFRTKDDGHA